MARIGDPKLWISHCSNKPLEARRILAAIGAIGITLAAPVSAETLHTFSKIQLTDKYWAEALGVGDINQDGHDDIIVGPYWYEGPDFSQRHALYPATETFERRKPDGSTEKVEGFDGALGSGDTIVTTQTMYIKVLDLNGDGWPDIFVVGRDVGAWGEMGGPPKIASWYENPGKDGLAKGVSWARHIVAEGADNQSLEFVDLFHNGHPVLLCMHDGQVGYFEPDPKDYSMPWTFHPISPKNDEYSWYSHGLGHGDLTGTGRVSILVSDGWYEQPVGPLTGSLWTFHVYPFALGPSQIKQYPDPGDRGPVIYDVDANGVPTYVTVYGGSQMYVYDVQGDGLPDVVMALTAHGYGLAWWEQINARGSVDPMFANGPPFKRHMIIGKKPCENPYGVEFTEMQALALADIDEDGLQDIVVGKRWWAHGNGGKLRLVPEAKGPLDPEANGPAVLYWLQLVRHAGGTAEFIPHLIDDDSGAGTQITVADVYGSGHQDILVANRKGAFLFAHHATVVSKTVWEKSQPKIRFPRGCVR